MGKSKHKVYTFRLSERDMEIFEQLKEILGLPQSDVIRIALRDFAFKLDVLDVGDEHLRVVMTDNGEIHKIQSTVTDREKKRLKANLPKFPLISFLRIM